MLAVVCPPPRITYFEFEEVVEDHDLWPHHKLVVYSKLNTDCVIHQKPWVARREEELRNHPMLFRIHQWKKHQWPSK